MRYLLAGWVVILALLGGGCAGQGAEDLYETAKLEELQNNPEHAAQLYQEILTRYPDSEYAAQARERLARLQQ